MTTGRSVKAAVLLLAVVAAAGTGIGPAQADVRPEPGRRCHKAGAAGTDDPAFYRCITIQTMLQAPHRFVRAAAQDALARSDDGAIRTFLTVGRKEAVKRAQQEIDTDAGFLAWVLAHAHPKATPVLFRMASEVAKSKDVRAARREFRQVGWQQALKQDRQAAEKRAEEKDRSAANVHGFVEWLADNAGGPQLKAAARRALRGDDELAEFFAYEWYSASDLDLQARQLRLEELDAQWQSQLIVLRESAGQAAQALREESDAASDKSSATAGSGDTPVANLAKSAADQWNAYAGEVRAGAGVWESIRTKAGELLGKSVEQSWLDDHLEKQRAALALAEDKAGTWQAVLTQARTTTASTGRAGA